MHRVGRGPTRLVRRTLCRNYPKADPSLAAYLVPAYRLAEKFGGAAEIEFFLDARAKRLHSLHADMHRLRDLARLATLPEQLKHLEFSVAQPLDRGLGGDVPVEEFICKQRRELVAKIQFPV